MTRLPKLIIILAAAITALLSWGRSDRNADRDARAAADKARYIYMQSCDYLAREDGTNTMLALQAAAALDPADPIVAGDLADLMLNFTPALDSVQVMEGYRALAARFFAAPSTSGHESFNQLMRTLGDYNMMLLYLRTMNEHFPDNPAIAFQRADLLLAIGLQRSQNARIDSAIAIYDSIEAASGPSEQLLRRRIKLATIGMADSVDVLSGIADYAAAYPADPQAMFNTAELYYIFDLEDSTAVYIDRACAIDSTFAPAFLGRANFAMMRGDTVTYNRRVEEILSSSSIEFEYKNEMLRDYTSRWLNDSTQSEHILALFGIMQEIHPGEPDMHRLYAAYLTHIGDSTAVDEMHRAVELDPDNGDLMLQLLNTQMQFGDTDGAITTGYEGTRRFGDMPAFPIFTALNLTTKSRAQEALDFLTSVDKSIFNNDALLAAYYRTLGDIYASLKSYAEAIEAYEKTLSYDHTDTMAMNNLAYFLAITDGNLDEALRLIERALSEADSNPVYLDTYAWVLFKRKNYAEARVQIDLALELLDEYGMADHTDYYDHAGDIYFMNGMPAEALTMWKKALELEPDNEKIARKVEFKTYFFDD